MQHDDLVYVGQMVDVTAKIEERALRLDRASYDNDEDVRLALVHLVQTLVVSRPSSAPHIPRSPGRRSSACATRSFTTT